MPKAIEVEDLSFSYPDGTPALKGVSFSAQEGECVGLIGSNGAGKTTLLLHLNGILQGAGRVRIFGKDVSRENLASIRKEVGLVFQNPEAQLFMPTVFDDVAFGPLNMGLGPEETGRRVTHALGSVDMQVSCRKISHHLSFGEKKRVSLATVLSMGPSILALDEPTSNLDPKHRNQLVEILRGLPMTKIIASHDLDMLSRLTDRLLVMQQGSIVASGRTRDILTDTALLKELGFYPSLGAG